MHALVGTYELTPSWVGGARGLETFVQIAVRPGGTLEFPAHVNVTDFPRFAYRGLMIGEAPVSSMRVCVVADWRRLTCVGGARPRHGAPLHDSGLLESHRGCDGVFQAVCPALAHHGR